MNVAEAEVKIAEKLEEFSAPLREAGLNVITRVLFADKTLMEKNEFDAKCILIYGDIAIGTDELDRDDYCNYSLCCEIKAGVIKDEEFTKEINNLDGEIEAFKDKLEGCENVSELISGINKEQENEADKAALQFAKEIKKIRLKLLIGLGVLILIIVGLIIAIPLIT